MHVFRPLTTERLIIRQAQVEDARALCERRNDPLVAENQNWTLPYPIEAATGLVTASSQMDGPANDDWWMATVTTPEGEILGDLAVRLEWEGRAAEIGYTFASKHWGRGYATESAGALVDWLFEETDVTRVSAKTHPENIASAMVLERLGFLFEGHTRLSYWVDDKPSDDWLFGLLRGDWEAWRKRRTEPPATVELVEITIDNVEDVYRLKTPKTQDRFVSTMPGSFTDALFPKEWDGGQATPWMRAVAADDQIVAFVMLALTNKHHPEPYLWRLLIGRMHQRRGIGRRVLDLIVEECREMGDSALLTSWVEGRGSPAPFYEAYGFEPTGNIIDGETEARLRFSRLSE